MDDFFIVRMTIVLSAAIIIGLLFTHFYAGHRVKGLLFAALGLTSSSIGFTFATLLPPLDILIYFANILFALGVMLFLLSTQRMIERKANYLEIIIVLTLF